MNATGKKGVVEKGCSARPQGIWCQQRTAVREGERCEERQVCEREAR